MKLCQQRGIGLVDAMIALAILIFSLSVTANLLTDTLVGMRITRTHLDLDFFVDEVTGIVSSNSADAGAGFFNVLFNAANPATPASASLIADWRDRVKNTLQEGESQITCTSLTCLIELRWTEYVDGAKESQTFQLKMPI